MRNQWSFVLVVLLALGLSWGAATVLAEDVGQFTRVVNQVDQMKKGKGLAVPAKVPGGVENQDQVNTKEKSMAVLQFVDESSMTISPKSKVTIEDYMYDAGNARSKGTIKIMEGVVESIIPTTDKLQQKNIQIRTTTAIAGIRGTRVVVATKPNEASIFYVVPDQPGAKPEKSKLKIRLFSPDTQPDAPAVQFVAEGLKKNLPLRQIVEEAMEKGLDPCEVIKALVLLGVDLEQIIINFQQVCSTDPEYEKICTPCLILKCALEARRALKEVEVSEGQYAILMANLAYAPIIGKWSDLPAILNLKTVGSDGPWPNYPPTQDQLDEAKLPREADSIAETLIKYGADPTVMNDCKRLIGVTAAPEALAYTLPQAVGTDETSLGGGQVPEEEGPGSRFQ
jgi:hypothetical protein